MHIVFFVFALSLGMAVSRPVFGAPKNAASQGGRAANVIRLASMLATFSTVALGFYLYEWWTPIVCFLIVTSILTLLINRKAKPFFLKIDPVVGGANVVLCGYCWYLAMTA
jgi:hypothetical protein